MQQSAWTALTAGTKVVMLFAVEAADYYHRTALITGRARVVLRRVGDHQLFVQGHGPLTERFNPANGSGTSGAA